MDGCITFYRNRFLFLISDSTTLSKPGDKSPITLCRINEVMLFRVIVLGTCGYRICQE